MADQYVQIQPDSTGKKIDVSELTVNANTVERQRMVIADNSGAANFATVTSSGALTTISLETTYSAKAVSISASGDNTIHTPASGKAVRLHYISVSADANNSAPVTATIKLAGSTLYQVSLAPGAIYSRNIGAGRYYLQGSSNGLVEVNLSIAQNVYASVEYEEI